MPIDDIRVQQRSQQSKAIQSRREAEGVVRIGDRDPVTGRYQVIEPDGGVDVGGVKVFNSQEQYGDRVLPFRRLDGTIALDSEKGSKARTPPAFPKCPGYLASQVFNCEEPPKKRKTNTIWILFIYKYRLYVGGHQQEPELIYDPIPPGISSDTAFNALPVNAWRNILEIPRYAQIWGDGQGWEASYGINSPVSTVVFAVEGESKNSPSYVRDDRLYAIPLGKGIYIRFNQIYVTTGDYVAKQSLDSWENTIADFDGAPKGSGYERDSYNNVFEGDGVFDEANDHIEAYPEPYPSKRRNYVRRQHRTGYNTSGRITEEETIVENNSCTILYRDRSQALFTRVNSQYYRSLSQITGSFQSGYTGSVDYLISDGKKDTVLFSTTTGGVLPPLSNGIHPTFNFPVITSIAGLSIPDPSSTSFNHLDSEKDYTVRVYDVYSESSLIDGIFKTVTLSAWGIPAGAQVLYTASYVP